MKGFRSFCISSVPSHTLSAEPAPTKRETEHYHKIRCDNEKVINKIRILIIKTILLLLVILLL